MAIFSMFEHDGPNGKQISLFFGDSNDQYKAIIQGSLTDFSLEQLGRLIETLTNKATKSQDKYHDLLVEYAEYLIEEREAQTEQSIPDVL